jgi:hypothetical protein
MTNLKKRNKLTNDIIFATEKILADAIAKKENTINSQNYILGLITPYEYLKTTKINY